MTATLLLMMTVLSQTPPVPAEPAAPKVEGKFCQVSRDPKPPGDCRAVLLSHGGFQLATGSEVSRRYPMRELSNRLASWKASARTSAVLIWAREHRLETETIDEVAAAAKRAGFFEATKFPGYVAPAEDAEVTRLLAEGCTDGIFETTTESLTGRPGAIDVTIVETVDRTCEDVRVSPEELEWVVKTCEALRNLHPEDAAVISAAGCTEIPSCARECAGWLEPQWGARVSGTPACEQFEKDTRRVPSSFKRLAETVWMFQRLACVIDAAERDPALAGQVKASCSDLPLLEDIRASLGRQGR